MMRAWLGSLFAGPNAKADEMAVLALLLGLCFIAAAVVTIGLEIFTVVARHGVWQPESFTSAMATLFGSAGVVFAAMACAMGLKARLGG